MSYFFLTQRRTQKIIYKNQQFKVFFSSKSCFILCPVSVAVTCCVLTLARVFFGLYFFLPFSVRCFWFCFALTQSLTLHHHLLTTRCLLLQRLPPAATHPQLPAGSGSEYPSHDPIFHPALGEQSSSSTRAPQVLRILLDVSNKPVHLHMPCGWYEKYHKCLKHNKNDAALYGNVLSGESHSLFSPLDVNC